MTEINFSILMSVYKNESPNNLKQSLDSIFDNTLLPSEVVIIEDGPLTNDLYSILNEYEKGYRSLIRIPIKENVGLGKALNIGLRHCSNEWVFRMDTDDICVPERFEKQISFIQNHPEIDILSGQIEEFENSELNITGVKQVPLNHNDIIKLSKTRNPFNHMAIAYRKSVIESVGGYQHHMYMEDYNLWLRVLASGYLSANLEDTLVKVRAGQDMIRRRRGKAYVKSEWQLLQLKTSLKYQPTHQALFIFIARSITRLLPSGMLMKVYGKLRKNQP